jgi:uncharacterized damage-inducible protein DinB
LAMLSGWVKETMTLDSLDIGKGDAPPTVKNRAEILEIFDKNVTVAKGILQSSTDDAAFFKPWSLLNNGTTLLTLPKIAVLRGFVFNHVVHHRAQLGVYLRLNDIPVPSIYGPSADENTF